MMHGSVCAARSNRATRYGPKAGDSTQCGHEFGMGHEGVYPTRKWLRLRQTRYLRWRDGKRRQTMDLFKRFVFGQAFNRNIRAVTGEERTTERFSVFEHKPFGKSFFQPPRSEACLTTSVLALSSPDSSPAAPRKVALSRGGGGTILLRRAAMGHRRHGEWFAGVQLKAADSPEHLGPDFESGWRWRCCTALEVLQRCRGAA